MNPRLDLLHPYPFEKLRKLLAGITPPAGLAHINLSIGEPQHATPRLLIDALGASMAGLSRYPITKGIPELRTAIANWLGRRYDGMKVDAETQVIPVAGTREALFAIAQTVLDPSEKEALVVCPNPFYQIYEGATLLAGATPYFLNTVGSNSMKPDWDAVPESAWAKVRLVFACSPGNPTGRVMKLEEWKRLFELSDRHGFVIISDECYSEIYFDESSKPLGGMEAAAKLGRTDFKNLVSMGSLSKRSNAPGLRSGFAAGDARVIEKFLLYRTYHGTAMSNSVQSASVAAWQDEAHVIENRRLYREKFAAFFEIVNPVLPLTHPEAAFYYWVKVPGGDDEAFARNLFAEAHITALPGSYLSRTAHGVNPGKGFLRIALVSTVADAVEGAQRIRDFATRKIPA